MKYLILLGLAAATGYGAYELLTDEDLVEEVWNGASEMME